MTMVLRNKRNIGGNSSRTTASSSSAAARQMNYLEWIVDCGSMDFLCQRPPPPSLPQQPTFPGIKFDAAQKHEELLDALIQEQTKNASQQSLDDSDVSLLRKRRRKNTGNSKQVAPVVDMVPSDPAEFFHPHCRLQKDKGKGEPIGSDICAKGREACLDKLRTKMRLLMEVGDQSSAANMKRKEAKVSHIEKFIETRSLLELRMGFLSMTYGILVRWDQNQQATLVVLRKMCNDSFYPVKSLEYSVPEEPAQDSVQCDQVVAQKNAITQRPEGTEVTLLEPPYLVSRPESFEPPLLTISIVSLTGLSKKSNWSMQLVYEHHLEKISFVYDNASNTFIPKTGEVMKHTITDSDLDLGNLELRLLESKPRSRTKRRLVCTMKVPLDSLQPQPASGAQPTRMQIPLAHDPETCVTLEMMLVSNYSQWVTKELKARHNQSPRIAWTEPIPDDDDADSPWNWICSVC
jgi:hypothetical protein